MQLQSLHQYIENINLGKKEYFFIKSFCLENQIELIDFFKKDNGYNNKLIKDFFLIAISKPIQDEEIIKYFLLKQEEIPISNFKTTIYSYGLETTYQHLLGLTKEEELLLYLKKKEYDKVIVFLENNPDFKKNTKLKEIVLNDFSLIEKFEKHKIDFDKTSYNKLDIIYNNILGDKEYNNNFIKISKFYSFIEKNKNKISSIKRKEYLESIINCGELSVYDFKKESYWDYVFIPLIHENEYPELTKNSNFFMDLVKYKEQIFSEENPYKALKIIPELSSKKKIELLLNYVKNYIVEDYNNTTYLIFTHFIQEVNKDFINDFFKLGIEKGYIFRSYLKSEYAQPYDRNNVKNYIEYDSKSLDNEIIRNHHEIIAKQILAHKNMFSNSVLKKYIPISKDILDKKDFLLSLQGEELTNLIAELKENNLPKTAAKVLEIRLENKIPEKGIKDKKLKI